MKEQQPLNSDTNISSFKNYALHGAFGGFSLSMGNYTVGENDRMTDIRIYTDGEVNDIGIYFSLDTGWGQILKIATEKDIDPVEGWQVVRLDVSVLCYD